MAWIQHFSVDKNAALVVAHLHTFMHDDMGVDVYISNIDNGYRISTWGGERSVDVTGHHVMLDHVLCKWKEYVPVTDETPKNAWDEDCSTHHIKQAFDLAEVIVSFVSRNTWPTHCERHHVTKCPS